MQISQVNRDVWLWLLTEGGYWRPEEVASVMKLDRAKLVDRMGKMARSRLLKVRKDGRGRKVYGVTGECMVPKSMTVAEVQA